jgi:hypothetical protein
MMEGLAQKYPEFRWARKALRSVVEFLNVECEVRVMDCDGGEELGTAIKVDDLTVMAVKPIGRSIDNTDSAVQRASCTRGKTPRHKAEV